MVTSLETDAPQSGAEFRPGDWAFVSLPLARSRVWVSSGEGAYKERQLPFWAGTRLRAIGRALSAFGPGERSKVHIAGTTTPDQSLRQIAALGAADCVLLVELEHDVFGWGEDHLPHLWNAHLGNGTRLPLLHTWGACLGVLPSRSSELLSACWVTGQGVSLCSTKFLCFLDNSHGKNRPWIFC